MSRLPEPGTVKRIGAIVVALVIVVAAGLVVGQAPALFGADVADDPEATISFADQTGDGTSAVVENVSVSEGGFVVLTDGEQVVGVSSYLEEGTHENVTVEADEDGSGELLGQLTATAHQDLTGNETFVGPEGVEEDVDHDRPYIDEDGYPVSDTATVSMTDRAEEATTSTSFLVESATAGDRVGENGSLEVTSEIRNPNDFEDRQYVDVRIDGEVRERQIISLPADESRQLNFTIDLGGVPPGEHDYGIFTTEDGAVDDFLVEFAPAAVTVTEASPETVIADATLAVEGYLAVEDENGSVVATSEALEYGTHENVTIDVPGGLSANETATVTVYDGDPDEAVTATPYVDDAGEPVRATAPVEDADETEDPLEGNESVDANASDETNGTNATDADASNETIESTETNESEDGDGNGTDANASNETSALRTTADR